MRVLGWAVSLGLAFAPLSASADVALLMAEEHGCAWCARWNAEIAHIYPKTDEGRTAPLVRFDLHEGPPEGFTLDAKVRFTPTFILTEDGIERARFEGYPGEDFFWVYLTRLFENADIEVKTRDENS